MLDIVWALTSLWDDIGPDSNQTVGPKTDPDSTFDDTSSGSSRSGGGAECVGAAAVLNAVATWWESCSCTSSEEGRAPPTATTSVPDELAQAATSDVMSFVWGYAGLMAQGRRQRRLGAPGRVGAGGGSREEEEAWGRVLDVACVQMAQRLRETVTGEELHPENIVDLAWGMAAAGRRSAPVAQLVEAVAHEVYRQLSNRYSLNARFEPHHVLRLLDAFVQLQYSADATVLRMLDAMSGYCTKGMRQRREAAFKRPADIAALLAAYRRLGHNSVVIPELLAAIAQQLVCGVATFHEQVHERAQSTHGWADASGASASSSTDVARRLRSDTVYRETCGREWDSYLTPDTAVQILDAYAGFETNPGQLLLTSLLLAVVPYQLRSASPAALAGLLAHLAFARHHPGDHTLTMVLQAIEHRASRSRPGQSFTPRQLLEITCAAAILRGPLSEGFVDQACIQCLVGIEEDPLPADGTSQTGLDGGKAAGSGEEEEGTTAADACRLLFALVATGRLNVQRLGLACMRVREEGGVEGVEEGRERAAGSRVESLSSDRGRGVARPWGGPAPAVCLAAATAALGEEGWEMAEEVLPSGVVGRLGRLLGGYLQRRWGDVQSADAAWLLRRAAAALQLPLESDGGGCSASSSGAVAGEAADVAEAVAGAVCGADVVKLAGSGAGSYGEGGGYQERQVWVLGLGGPACCYTNDPERLTGEAEFQRRVVRAVLGWELVVVSATAAAMVGEGARRLDNSVKGEAGASEALRALRRAQEAAWARRFLGDTLRAAGYWPVVYSSDEE